MLEGKDEGEEESEVDEKVKEVRGRKRKHLEPMCDVQGMCMTTAETETDYEDCNNYAHAHVFPKCFKSLHTLLGFVLCFVLILCFVSSMVFLSL